MRSIKLLGRRLCHGHGPRSILTVLVMAAVSAAGLGVATLTGSQQANAETFWREGPPTAKKLLSPGDHPLPSLSGLVKTVKPAVVNIYTTQVIQAGTHRSPHSLFEEFFGRREGFGGFGPHFGMPGREMKRNSLGSGLIVSADGYIVTNHHVVENASKINVRLADDQGYEATVVGGDRRTDIVLLKIEAKQPLPSVPLGNSDTLEVGDWVVAIGNPFGLGHTVTAGIVSGKARQIGHGPYDDFLQTDASINPGNSGGPLFDTAGNVVGINTAIISGGNGVGFAVPINLVKSLLPGLREHGKVTRGWLGVGIQDLDDTLAKSFGVETHRGVLVSQVFDDGPAGKAGMQAGDIIVSVNGTPVQKARQLTALIARVAPGTSADLELLREGRTRTLSVELGEREQGEAVALRGGRPGETSELGAPHDPLSMGTGP